MTDAVIGGADVQKGKETKNVEGWKESIKRRLINKLNKPISTYSNQINISKYTKI